MKLFNRAVVLFMILTTICGIAVATEPLQVSLSSDTVGKYQKIEMHVIGIGDFNQPYNPAQVKLDAELISPSGKTVTVPGFAYHQMQQARQGRGVRFTPQAGWQWKIRYSPDETGIYKGKVKVTTPLLTRTSKQFEFSVAPSNSKGFIRVAKGNRWAFEYDDGSPYIAIGHNLSWANGDRLGRYQQWLDKMAANGCNFIRIWFGAEWCFGIEGPSPYNYNEDAAELFEQVLRMCEDRGIAVKLCFEHIRRFQHVPGNYNFRKDYPYIKANGGPCETVEDFMILDEAKQQWKALQRYIVARYGYSTSIFAWELWNEINEADFFREAKYPGAQSDWYIAQWTNEMCSHLKQIDPHKHLTSNSLGSGARLHSMWYEPAVDFVQYHDYASWPWNAGELQYEVYGEPIRWLRHIGKPVLLAEAGLSGDQMREDPNGYAFHETLWVGFFAGGAGTGHSWWWDNVIDPLDLYGQYKPFAKFVDRLPVNTAPLPPCDATVSPANLRCYARKANWGAIAWVVNRNDGWRSLVLEGKQPEPVSGGELKLLLDFGDYELTFMDCRTGKILAESKLSMTAMNQAIPLPDFEIDLAVKVLRR